MGIRENPLLSGKGELFSNKGIMREAFPKLTEFLEKFSVVQ
jgi:hypothetical protein